MSEPEKIDIKRDAAGGKIWSHLRKKWLVETPEETVRQQYLLVLHNEYGYSLNQMAEELDTTGRGHASARADFVIWRTEADKTDSNSPSIIVECKSDNVTVSSADYAQGEAYARLAGAPFFVTHNSRETRYWSVRRDKLPGYTEEIENIPHAESSDAEIKELLSKLRVFREKEFADLLHRCHNIIRNREKKDPAAAFDEIAKVLFVKVYVERQLLTRKSRTNVFTTDVLKSQLSDNPLDSLFQMTKAEYSTDKLFAVDEKINLKPSTAEAIVRTLEKYNLSDTSEDVKGVAFERFLGKTFRGEIGQFFTPRTVVEFIVRMIQPKEGELVCDPASGSGGFLIRAFEMVRQQILADIDLEYAEFRSALEADSSYDETSRARLLQEKYAELQSELDQSVYGSRMWHLSNESIFGTDANDRMARTGKMNMIMHGDGHGGIHHHDGFLNVNGIFDGRFDVVLTNPPFGSSVEASDKVSASDFELSAEVERKYTERYGDDYKVARARLKSALNQPIASLFELPPNPRASMRTEILFIERSLNLLKPGGRLAIVLPEGVFNNPSLNAVREFVEDRAFIDAVVSLPPETFVSSGAMVKCSLLFLTKFTVADAALYESLTSSARAVVSEARLAEVEGKRELIRHLIREASESGDNARKIALRKELVQFEKANEAQTTRDVRARVKAAFDYEVFMFDARAVGITATGEEGPNDLYADEASSEKSCLELYGEFIETRAPRGAML